MATIGGLTFNFKFRNDSNLKKNNSRVLQVNYHNITTIIIMLIIRIFNIPVFGGGYVSSLGIAARVTSKADSRVTGKAVSRVTSKTNYKIWLLINHLFQRERSE
uniref:Uncharacterized protein n=1 Tax=Glossina brevipalpis TaxID=37001 RepID=A0A1A9WU03_9MUSC